MSLIRYEQNDAHEFFLNYITTVTEKMDLKSVMNFISASHCYHYTEGSRSSSPFFVQWSKPEVNNYLLSKLLMLVLCIQ